MKINIHAGHNPDGKVACGAIGLIKESTEARKVKNEVIRLLRLAGHTVYDTTCEAGKSQSDVLNKIIDKCNSNTGCNLDISIHFNAGRNDLVGDGVKAGSEVWLWDSKSGAAGTAKRVLDCLTKIGYKNRGIKYSKNSDRELAVLKRTKAPAMLLECCFVDDKDDVKMYNYKTMAQAIAEGINEGKIGSDQQTEKLYKVQTGAYKNKINAENLIIKLSKEKISGYIVNANGYYKVQTGAFGDKTNAEKMKETLNEKGFDAVIV